MNKKYPDGIKLPSDFRSDRSIAMAANRHCTAFTVIGSGSGVRVQAESHLELVNLIVLSTKLNVQDIVDQVIFTWRNLKGTLSKHIFDYVAYYHDGSKTGFAVKPDFRALSYDFSTHMQEVAWFATSSGFCDDVRILTESSSDRIEQRNSQLFWAVRASDPEADDAAIHVASRISGAVSLRDLASA